MSTRTQEQGAGSGGGGSGSGSGCAAVLAASCALLWLFSSCCPCFMPQVVVSDVGATIPGVTPDTLQRFLLDLARAVAGGCLLFCCAVSLAVCGTGRLASGRHCREKLAA